MVCRYTEYMDTGRQGGKYTDYGEQEERPKQGWFGDDGEGGVNFVALAGGCG